MRSLYNNYIISFWWNAFNFKGRATRKEYWTPFIINSIFYILLFLFSLLIFLFPVIYNATCNLHDCYQYLDYSSDIVTYLLAYLPVPCLLLSALLSIPNLTLQIRRLRDIGKSTWLVLLFLIPCLIGQIILLFWSLQPSKR